MLLPVIMQTMGRIATLNKAAEAADIPVDEFLSGIAVEINKRTGQAVERDT